MISVEQDLIEEFGTSTFSEVDPVYKALGYTPGPVDDRDWKLEDHLGVASLPKTSGRTLWSNPIQLMQGQFGACTGFGACGFSNANDALGQIHEYSNDYAFYLYQENTLHDAFPGRFDAKRMVQVGGGRLDGSRSYGDVEA